MMHVSWTTLREQIFAKLRRPYRSEADMNEVGHASNRQFFDLIYKRHNNSKGQLTLTFFDMPKFDRSKFFVRHST
jgi:hypothetical protein